MIDTDVAQEIARIYRACAAALPGFRARSAQKTMIRAVAGTLASPSSTPTVIEAPTGTGKSLAYLSGVIPVARHAGKKLVISTSTVALQEQLLHKDLPFIVRAAQLPIAYAAVKGRARYACPLALDALAGVSADQLDLGLGGTDQGSGNWPFRPTENEKGTVAEMRDVLTRGEFSGDLDAWPDRISARLRPQLSMPAYR